MEEEPGISIEEAEARNPGCLIVAVQYGKPVLPEYPKGCWCLLAVPTAKLDWVDTSKLPEALRSFVEFRPRCLELHVPKAAP